MKIHKRRNVQPNVTIFSKKNKVWTNNKTTDISHYDSSESHRLFQVSAARLYLDAKENVLNLEFHNPQLKPSTSTGGTKLALQLPFPEFWLVCYTSVCGLSKLKIRKLTDT